MQIRHSIENFFEAWSKLVVTRRWLILFSTIVVSSLVIPQIRHGYLDVSIESFMPEGDPVIMEYNYFRDEFSYTPGSVIAIKTPDSMFELHNLKKLREFHEAIEEQIPHLAEVTSLVNVRYTRGENDTLISSDLGDLFPTTEEEIAAFREIVMSNSNYVGGIISEDETVTSILVEPNVFSASTSEDELLDGFDDGDFESFGEADLGGGFETGITDDSETAGQALEQEPVYLLPTEEKEFAEAVLALSEQFRSEDFYIHNAGGPTMNMTVSNSMERSITKSSGMGIIIIIVLLAVLFRRVSGVLLPLLVVQLSLFMTLAIWPMMGYAFNSNTSIIPTFILAVGIADSIHILAIFYKHYDGGMEKNQAITQAVRQTSIAVLMTTVTTAVGLLSFLASSMVPSQTLGIFGAIGVIMAMVYTLFLLPSILAILPIKRRVKNTATGNSASSVDNTEEKSTVALQLVDAFIAKLSDFGVQHAKFVVMSSALFALVALYGASQVQFKHDPISWFPDESPLPTAVDVVDHKLDGSLTGYILIDTGEKNGLHEPKFLNALEEIEQRLLEYRYEDVQINDVMSILSVIKDTHKSLNNNNDEYYKVPQNRELVSQELLLFESGSDDVYDFADYNQQVARLDIQMNWGNVLHYRQATADLNRLVKEVLAKHGLQDMQVKVVGLLAIFGKTLFELLKGTVQSYMIAFVFVALFMWMMMSSVRRGLIAFSPNVFPILTVVGLMGLMGVPLNVYTSTIGCIVIGISVDDTIHFMHHFRYYSQKTNDVREAVRLTLATCGRAITFTSIVLVGGFIVHLSGELSPNHQFGWLLSLAIILALLANLILAPALLKLFWRPDPLDQKQLDPAS